MIIVSCPPGVKKYIWQIKHGVLIKSSYETAPEDLSQVKLGRDITGDLDKI